MVVLVAMEGMFIERGEVADAGWIRWKAAAIGFSLLSAMCFLSRGGIAKSYTINS